MQQPIYIVQQAIPQDSKRVWEIRYHPAVNATALNQNTISFEEHDQWFQKKYFSETGNYCFVIKNQEAVAGYCRFDSEGAFFRVSIAIDPLFHGQGLGARLLGDSLSRLPTGATVVASIKKDNSASRSLFTKNGFLPNGGNTTAEFFKIVI